MKRLWRFAYSILIDSAPFTITASWVLLMFWCAMYQTHTYTDHDGFAVPYMCWQYAFWGVLAAPFVIYFGCLYIHGIARSLLVVPVEYIGTKWRESAIQDVTTEPSEILVRGSQETGDQLLRGIDRKDNVI